jgi:hypothetical protein
LFQRFLWTQMEFGYETGSIRKLILLSFYPYKERLKQSWYVIWATILVWTVPGIRIGFQLDLD